MVGGEEGFSTVVGAAGGAFTTPVAFMCGACRLDRLMSSKPDCVGLAFWGEFIIFTFAIVLNGYAEYVTIHCLSSLSIDQVF